MMSMALATGAACPAFAKAAEKEPADQDWRFATLPGEDAGSRSPGLLDSMKLMLAGHGPDTAGKGWQLGLLPPEPKAHFETDSRPVQTKRWGLALRLAF